MFVAAGAALILWLNGGDGSHATLLALLAAVTGGFLAWNWPPARIFMGDACSGFLGLSIGLMALATSTTGAINLWTWLILYGVFAVDATCTLACRSNQRPTVLRGPSQPCLPDSCPPMAVAPEGDVAVLAVNMCWLFPLAIVSSRYPEYGVACAALALAPLVAAVQSLSGPEQRTAKCIFHSRKPGPRGGSVGPGYLWERQGAMRKKDLKHILLNRWSAFVHDLLWVPIVLIVRLLAAL